LAGLSFHPSGSLPALIAAFSSRVPKVARHRHDGRVQYLPATRDIPLPGKMFGEELEQRLHLARLRQRLAIQPNGLGVRYPVSQPKPKEPHEGQPVPDLILDLIVRQVQKARPAQAS